MQYLLKGGLSHTKIQWRPFGFHCK